MAEEDIPELEDFSEELTKAKKESNVDIGDYARPREEKPLRPVESKQQVEKEAEPFSGLKKGFLTSGS